ncbi:MAG: ATP-binding protein [Deltaproteobacteria bacterium]|nr:ATP-binding protein [Deltaproteobacteria bacterium]
MSKTFERRQRPHIESDLAKKMVLVAGPRQCGKTTLARSVLAHRGGAYYSWDIATDRAKLKANKLDEAEPLWVFDEIHKSRHWRNWLKGVWDEHRERHEVLVTGSARLDVYGRGGDSLQGRYFKHRLHPITFSELAGLKAPRALEGVVEGGWRARRSEAATEHLSALLTLGGFPEPLFGGSEVDARRWRGLYGELLVRDDIRTLEMIRDLDKLEMLYDRLPELVGSVLSINALREDLEVSFETVRHWVSVLEHTYACFRVPPFGAPRIKAVKKEQKLYCWDWARVESAGAAFENLIAVHLLRFVHFAEDVWGERLELRYFRDVVGHEVDFIVMRGRKPWLAVECKLSDGGLASGLRYLLERVRIPHAVQVTATEQTHVRRPSINGAEVFVVPATAFLSALP